ncbi:MAG: 1,4-alpha-glucan branching protein GlgB [Ruminococcus sp.]|nr:1,4-alpha-glucan branching protein GlgB [Ruminococcus sp.]
MNYTLNDERTALDVFHAGDSVHAYELFGAHIVNWDNRNGVVFRVWAPNARSVSVVGDFNNWDNNLSPMYKVSDGVWELFVENIKTLAMYKFCIETPSCDKILKSDPYAFYSQTRLESASIVYNLDDYKWNDNEWLEKRKSCNHSKEPMSVYEVHLGSWMRDNDGNSLSYRELAEKLIPYLKDMHYTHIQILPVMEYPFDGSWGYQVTGYYAITSRYGTPDDFMYFVDMLHNAGIGIILDWVPSNFPKDDFGLVRFDGSYLYESDDPMTNERQSWGTCLFDLSKNEVLSFLVSSAMFWLNKYHIDGIRVGSLSSMLYLDYDKKAGEWKPNKFGGKENLETIGFIARLNTAVHMYHPDVMMFAEETTSWPKLTKPVEEGGLGFDYKWNMGWMNDMLHYMSLNPLWRPFNHDNLTFSFFYAFSEHFLLPISHDEVSHGMCSLMNKMPGDYDEKFAGVRAFITYMFAHPGKKLIFMGTEIGQFDEWNVDASVQWDLLEFEKHSQLQRFFREMNEFYFKCRPLFDLDNSWRGFDWIHHDDYTNSVIAFKRTDSEGNNIIAVCNFQPKLHHKYNIGVPVYGLYDEIFNSDRTEYGGTGVTNGSNILPERIKIHGCNQGLSLTLPPLSVIYLRCTQKLDYPEAEYSEE